MLQLRSRIAEGDLVIVYEDYARMSAVRVCPPKIFYSKFGEFPHSSMVGMRFGQRLNAAKGKNFVYLLSPTPELWTETIHHRTQILYVADISMIVMHLDVLPGCRVIEAGTGSGALSHALARSVGSTGHLFTYEFNEQRAAEAAKEFAANGLSDRVTARHGDACITGTAYNGIESESIDAVVFDLPQPWEAVVRKGSNAHGRAFLLRAACGPRLL